MEENRTEMVKSSGYRKIVLLSALTSLLLSFGLFIQIGYHHSSYFASTEKNPNPDAIDYGRLSKSMVHQAQFSRVSDGRPDPLRTPGYPALLAALRADLSPIPIYLMQIAMVAGLAGMLSWKAACLFGKSAGTMVGLLVSLDPSLQVLSFQSMTEVSGLFFFVVGLFLVRWPEATFQSVSRKTVVAASVLLGFSVLIRPSLLLFPVIVAILSLAWRHLPTPTSAPSFGRVFLFCAIFALLPAAWVSRNYFVFGFAKLTPVSTHNLVYFVGAGAVQFETGKDRYEVQDWISKEFDLPTYSIAQNPYNQDEKTIYEIEKSLSQAQWRIVLAKPVCLLAAESIGAAKGTVSHSMEDLSSILGQEWANPGLAGLLQLRRESLDRLFQNLPITIGAFVLHIVHSVILISGASMGLILSFRSRLWGFCNLNILSLVLYGYFTVSMFGIDAVYRARIVPLPGLVLLAGVFFGTPNGWLLRCLKTVFVNWNVAPVSK
jgi:hypothetical protein